MMTNTIDEDDDVFVLSQYLRKIDFDNLDENQKNLINALVDIHCSHMELHNSYTKNIGSLYKLLVLSTEDAIKRGSASADFKKLISSIDKIAEENLKEINDKKNLYNNQSIELVNYLKKSGIK